MKLYQSEREVLKVYETIPEREGGVKGCMERAQACWLPKRTDAATLILSVFYIFLAVAVQVSYPRIVR